MCNAICNAKKTEQIQPRNTVTPILIYKTLKKSIERPREVGARARVWLLGFTCNAIYSVTALQISWGAILRAFEPKM